MNKIDRAKILVLAAAAFGVAAAACSRDNSASTVGATPSATSGGQAGHCGASAHTGGGAHQGSCGSCGATGHDGGAAPTSAATTGAHQGSCGSCGATGHDGGADH